MTIVESATTRSVETFPHPTLSQEYFFTGDRSTDLVLYDLISDEQLFIY